MIPVKNAAELEGMKKACRVAMEALRAGGALVKPGVSTAEIDKAVYDTILRLGGQPNFKGQKGPPGVPAFPGSACISLNDTVIHGIPSRGVVLKEGDIVSIDTGAIVEGFHGDNAYTFCCGEVTPEAQRLLEATEASLYEAIGAAVPGARMGDVSHAVQSHVEARGYSVVREFVGHGVGRSLHEPPEVPNFGRPGRGVRLVPGMTLAIEPMVNEGAPGIRVLDDGWTVKTRDGSLSAHFEHTVAITADGPLILTKW